MRALPKSAPPFCHDTAYDACAHQQMMERLAFDRGMWDPIANSWRRGNALPYGRFDIAHTGVGLAELLEFSADSPTNDYEAAF